MVSAFEVQCDMPFSILDRHVRWSSVVWLVSVANDNARFSDNTTVVVFDSKCISCGDNDTCAQKVFYIELL